MFVAECLLTLNFTLFYNPIKERACVFDEQGNGRFVRDIRMTGPMILPLYTSAFLSPEVLIDRKVTYCSSLLILRQPLLLIGVANSTFTYLIKSLATPTLKILGRDSNQGVDWNNVNTMVFDRNVESWVEKFNQRIDRQFISMLFYLHFVSYLSTSGLSELVTTEMLDGDHHFFVEEENAKTTAKLISDFISSQ